MSSTTPDSEQSIRNEDTTRSELYRLASLVGTDAKTPFTKLCDFIDAYVAADRLRTAKEARIDELQNWREMVLRLSKYVDSPDSLIEYDERIKELQENTDE